MSAATTHNSNTTDNAGVPPAPPEAHQKAVSTTAANLNLSNSGTIMQNAQANVAVEQQAAAVVLETAIGNDGDFAIVPLSSLVVSPFNVRKKAPTRIPELAENIRAKGLLQNLVVHKIKGRGKTGKNGVAAGQRRMLSLQLLASQGHIDGNYGVRVKIVSEAEAVEISLSENTEHEPMHPADEFLAFKALLDDGKSIEYVAALFGISPTTVIRRMKLVSVSPKLFELFAADQIHMEQLIALAVTDDHEAQESVWFASEQDWMREPRRLRERLTADKIGIRNNRIVDFVGLAAYEAAGGIIERDLFSDDNSGYISDSGLLMRLHDAKLAESAAAIKAEGWSWVETRAEFDYTERNRFGELYPVPRPLTDEETQTLKALTDERDAAQEKLDAYYDAEEGEETISNDDANALEDKVAGLDEQIGTLENRAGDYSAEQMAVSGAIVLVGWNGAVDVKRGMVRPEDKATARDAGHAQSHSSGLNSRTIGGKEKGIHSEKLTKQLTAHRTAAVQAELAARPDVALAVMVHKLMLSVFSRYGGESAAQVSVTVVDHQLTSAAPDMEASDAWKAIQTQREEWRAKLPNKAEQYFPWILEQTQETKLALLAFCTAATIDGISGNEKAHAIGAVAGALDLNMSNHWTATAEGYFSQVSKTRIVDVLTAAVSPEAANDVKSMKKADAAAFAEARIAGKGWTPEVFSATNAPEAEADRVDDEADDTDEASTESTLTQQAATDNAQKTEIAEANDDDATDAPQKVIVPAAAWPFPTAHRLALSRHAAH